MKTISTFRFLLATFSSVLVFFTIDARSADTNGIRKEHLKAVKDGIPGELEFKQEIAFAKDLKLTTSIEVTTKGHGWLKVANLNLKVFDSNNDGAYYEDGL